MMSLSPIALIAVNVFPLIGVLWLGWDLFSIMVLYWIENMVIGFWNLVKMGVIGIVVPLQTGGADRSTFDLTKSALSTLGIMVFFAVHYGGFMLGHGLFIFVLFGPGSGLSDLAVPTRQLQQVFVPALFLLVSHGVSFFHNFFGKGEFRNTTVQNQMGQPYKRIFLLHVAIIFAGFAIMSMNAPELALAFLIVLKTLVDLFAHLKEHAPKKE